MNKFKQIVKTKDKFKRDYILEAMRRIMNNSFIVNKLGSLGTIPEDVEREMELLKNAEADAVVVENEPERKQKKFCPFS